MAACSGVFSLWLWMYERGLECAYWCPSCLLKIYLELKPAAHGGRSDSLLRELVTGPCSALFSASILHFQHRRPKISAKISTFLLGRAALPTGSGTANEGVHGFCGHVFTNRAGAGLNPRLGNELQLQEEKSNYIKPVPLDEPPGRRSSSGTHLQPPVIASNLQQRIHPSERGVEGDESCRRESAS